MDNMLSNPYIIAAIACGGAAGALLAWSILETFFLNRDSLSSEIVQTETKSPYFRLFRPMAGRIGMEMRGAFSRKKDIHANPGFYRIIQRKMGDKLASAGHPEGINADEYVGFITITAGLGAALGLFVFLMAEPGGIGACCFIGAALGAWKMYSWLKLKAFLRHNSIRKQLPFALDLLTLSIEAGLDFTSALAGICKKLGSSPLGEEFSLMLREIQMGKSRSEAMRDLAKRTDVGEVQSVVSSLVQAEELGANIGPILRIQAAQQRERRSQRAEEAAGKAPVKIIFPLLIFLLVTILIIFSPIIVGLLS